MPTRKKFEFFQMRNFPLNPNPEPPSLPPDPLDTDFKKKYPPDLQIGHELDDNARVWKIYRDEAIQHDDGMLQAWNNTINILLTFSGLFSAAVTAFVVESYQFLQTGSAGVGSASKGLAVRGTAASSRSARDSPGHPSSSALVINGLWFTSLFFSLAAAFLCILIKQWLDEYTVRTRASSQNPRHWSRRRAFYFRALDDWGVYGIISVLPVLLHAALFLFFAGMIVLLSSLTTALAIWLCVLAGTLLVLYGIAICIPLWNSACPFATPLVTQVRRVWNLSRIWLLTSEMIRPLRIWIREHLSTFMRVLSSLSQATTGASATAPVSRPANIPTPPLYIVVERLREQLSRSAFDQLLSSSPRGFIESASNSLPNLAARLDCDALCWLLLSVSDNDASSAAFQALGAITPCSSLATLLRARNLHRSSVRSARIREAWFRDCSATEVARVIRGVLALGVWEEGGRAIDQSDGDRSTVDQSLFHLWGFFDRPYLSNGLPHPHLEILKGMLNLTFDEGRDLGSAEYRRMRDICMSLVNGRSPVVGWLHYTAIQVMTLGIHYNMVLLFLCLCDHDHMSSAQWVHILLALQSISTPCPQHPTATSVGRFMCILEGLFVRLLAGDTSIDHTVVRKLLDVRFSDNRPDFSASFFPNSLPHDSPTWVSYLMSTAFRPRTHSSPALRYLLRQLDLPSKLTQIGPPVVGWLKLWRRVAHLVRVKGGNAGSPLNLITLMLWDTTTTPPTLSHTVLRTVLCDGRRPSLWRIVSPSYDERYPRLAEVLAVALCSITRSHQVDFVAHLVDLFFAPIDLTIMTMFMEIRARFENYPERRNDIHLIAHILELRPSWWVRGVNRLEYDDEEKRRLRAFVISTTTEVLRQGPCRDCLSAAPPETFRIWVHDLDDARSGFLSSHDERDAALLELEANENDGEGEVWYPYDYGTLDDWKSDDEDDDGEASDGM